MVSSKTLSSLKFFSRVKDRPKLTPTFLMSVLARCFKNRFTTACVGVGVGEVVTTVLVVVVCAEVDDCGAGLTVVAT